MLAEFRDVLFGGRLPSLVLNMISDEGISTEDANAIRAALAKVESQR